MSAVATATVPYTPRRRYGARGRPLVPTKAITNPDGSKKSGSSPYKLGRAFEGAIKGRLIRRDYFVMRAYGSKGKIDLLAVKATVTTVERGPYLAKTLATHIVLGVQCKRRGDIGSTEWNELFDLCAAHGIMPVVAVKASERTVAFYRLDAKRIPHKAERPWTEIDPATGEPLPEQMALA